MMIKLIFTGLLSALLAITVQAETIRKEIACSSFEGAFNRCALQNANNLNVKLSQNLGDARCRKDYTWGADSDGVWVSDDCSAVFTYDHKIRDSANNNRPSQKPWSCPDKWAEGTNECAYFEDGFDMGQKDFYNGSSKDYERHNRMYDSRFEKPFKKGYKKGYKYAKKKGRG